MSTLREMLKSVDDDYLAGLCNKGTVKRACKDLAQETPAAEWKEEEAEVTLREETCVIRMPLGESTCSCPSRSICRHIITAILWLKQESEEQTVSSEKNGRAETPSVLEEVLQIPAEQMKKACRGRRYQQFLAHIRSEGLPPVEERSIVTVTLPWEETSVRLLEPFVYSTCTCHSKELCAHKAQAVLVYQMAKGKLTLEKLEQLQEEDRVLDELQVRQACESVRESIIHQLCTGLSRQSPDISESLERLAVITHRAGLPAMESRLREAAAEYRLYFSRSAAFRNERLFRTLLWIYGRAEKIGHADCQEEMLSLAGTFRDSYEPVGTLHLLGMGGRTFSGKTGYEGEIYYFLETEQKRWYTWTDARPVFYEGVRRRPAAAVQNAAAPWGLNCSREQLQSLEFDLMNAKAASGGRLSVSQESRGEARGSRTLQSECVQEMIAWDYEELLAEYFSQMNGAKKQTENRIAQKRERPVLVGAVDWGESHFDTIQQRFSWKLYDRRGNTLFLSVNYMKEERLTIGFLERLEKRLKKYQEKAIIFFGSLYLDGEGRLCLYPIEFFDREAEQIAEKAAARAEKAPALDRGKLPSAELIRTMEQFCKEASGQLWDLFVSGLWSVQEDTADGLEHLAKDGERLGLHRAGSGLGKISQLLRERRHQMEFSPEPVLTEAQLLMGWLSACREKISCDLAEVSMKEKKSASDGCRAVREEL